MDRTRRTLPPAILIATLLLLAACGQQPGQTAKAKTNADGPSPVHTNQETNAPPLAALKLPIPTATALDEPLLNPDHPNMNQTAPDTFTVRLDTSQGNVDIQVTRSWAPLGADRFYNLVVNGFYDQCRFFRVLKGFVVQFGINGDPKISAAWRQDTIQDDPVTKSNVSGTLTFATSGPNSRTTQLFINLEHNEGLDGQGFSPFGRVTDGMDKVELIFGGYGEKPNQNTIQSQGNSYLEQNFPKMDYIITAQVVE